MEEKKLYQLILEKVKRKINDDRYQRNLEPLTGETLNCIANRDVGIILDLVAEGKKLYKEVLEKIFYRYIPEITEIMVDMNRDNDAISAVKEKYNEEIAILDEFLFRIQAGMEFKETCKIMSKEIDQ